ncbi:MAG TPA: thiamine pyrophosphate-dependent enzyme [Chloroflexota bacterium]|nr:thiamine pyrophosphate-dependent enzyme [Chloroflexota bacterium]
MMDLRAAVQALVARRTDELVIVPFTGGIAWEDASSLPALDLPFWGSMGKAGSTGLGVALAVPTLRVWVLDGDGSLLMNLGTLVTEASQAPRNFYHFVLENGVYRTTGGQPIPGHEQVSFAGLARGAGFPHVCEFDDLAALERDLPAVVGRPGPTFVTLKVSPEPLDRRLPRRTLKAALPAVRAAIRARAGAA